MKRYRVVNFDIEFYEIFSYQWVYRSYLIKRYIIIIKLQSLIDSLVIMIIELLNLFSTHKTENMYHLLT